MCAKSVEDLLQKDADAVEAQHCLCLPADFLMILPSYGLAALSTKPSFGG